MTSKMIVVATLISASQLLPAQDAGRISQSPESAMRVAEKIRKKIVMLSNYGVFDFVSFSLAPAPNGYRVTLQGFASRPTLKDSAERGLRGLEELDGVDNKIEVLPLSPADERVRMAAYAKIYYHASLSRYNPNRGAPVFGGTWNARRSSQMGISTNPPPGAHPHQPHRGERGDYSDGHGRQ